MIDDSSPEPGKIAGFIIFFWVVHTSFPAFLIPGGAENAALGVGIAGIYLILKRNFTVPFILSFFALLLVAFGLLIGKSISAEALVQTLLFSFMPIIVVKLLPLLTIDRLISYIRVIYLIWVVLSLVALVGLGNLLAPILRLLFAADSGLDYNFSGRGGSGLTFPEQSHIAPYIALFLYCLFFHGTKRDKSIALIGMLPIVLVNGSRTLIVLLLVVLFFQFIGRSLLSIKKVLQLLILFGIVFFILMNNPFIGRSVEGLVTLFFDFDINRTAQIMSGRAIANYVYIYDLVNYPFGHGFELTRDYFFAAADTLQVDYTAIGAFDRTGRQGLPIYPRSYLVYFIYCYGILGILFVLATVRYCCKNVPFSALTLLAFIQIFVVGLPSLTAPWLTLGIARLLHENSRDAKKTSGLS